MKKVIVSIIIIILSISYAFAHAGRTDAQGGHFDKKNESGLGAYHYHHGYTAHLHDNGVCPYDNTATTQAEPQEPEQEESTEESISEEDIDYTQFETLEEAYQAGYYYALYEEYSNLYEENENRSKLESLLNLGIATNLYFNNSEITYSDEVEVEDFTNKDAFEEGVSTGLADLENALSEFKNKYEKQPEETEEKVDINGIKQSSYQEGYKKGINDAKKDYKDEKKPLNIEIILLMVLAIGYIIYVLHQLILKLSEEYPSIFIEILMIIINILLIITIIPNIILILNALFAKWVQERGKKYEEQDKQLLFKHYEMFKNGEYLPQILELEEFKRNGWIK